MNKEYPSISLSTWLLTIIWVMQCSVLLSFRDGNLQDIVGRGSLHDFLVSLHQEFGPVASFWFGSRPVVSLGSLQQLQQHINPNHSSMFT